MKIVFEYRFFHRCQEFIQCPFKVTYLGCELDEGLSGEAMALKVINKIT